MDLFRSDPIAQPLAARLRPANLDEFTQTQWVSVMESPITYPF